MSDCLFCKIAAGDIPATLVHEDERCLAFEDIQPQAPMHVLVIPREHLESLNDVGPAQADLAGHLLATASSLARSRGYGEAGYRTVINCREGAGQSVFHLHVHVLAGRPFTWPPG